MEYKVNPLCSPLWDGTQSKCLALHAIPMLVSYGQGARQSGTTPVTTATHLHPMSCHAPKVVVPPLLCF